MPLLLGRREMHGTEEHRAIDRIAYHEPVELSGGDHRLVQHQEPVIGPALQRRGETGDGAPRSALVEGASQLREAICLRDDEAAQPE
jgi:hypothetical protein